MLLAIGVGEAIIIGIKIYNFIDPGVFDTTRIIRTIQPRVRMNELLALSKLNYDIPQKIAPGLTRTV